MVQISIKTIKKPTQKTRLIISPPRPRPTFHPKPKAKTNTSRHGPFINQFQAWLTAFPNPQAFLLYFSKKLSYYKRSNSKFKELLESLGTGACGGTGDLGLMDKLHEREQSLFQLQDALSHAGRQLSDERENYLNLAQANAQLQLELQDYKHKFQVVLLLNQSTERDVEDYIQNHPKAPQLTDQMMKIRQQIQQVDGRKGTEMHNPLILWKQNQLLKAQLQEKSEFYQTKVQELKKELELVEEERGIRIELLNFRLKAVADKLRCQNELLHTVLLNSVQARQVQIQSEEEWARERSELLDLISIESLEGEEGGNGHKTPLLQQITSKRLGESQSKTRMQHLEKELARTQNKLLETESSLQNYEWKLLKVQKSLENSKCQESQLKSEFERTVRKLLEKNHLLEKRLVDWDTKRKLDNQGFHQDLSKLRKFLDCIKHQADLVPKSSIKIHSEHQDQGIPIPRSKSAPAPLTPYPNLNQCGRRAKGGLEKDRSGFGGSESSASASASASAPSSKFPSEIHKLLQVASHKLESLEKKYHKM